MSTHWLERAILALPGFKLETAEELARRDFYADARDPRICFFCFNRHAVCTGPWGVAWLVGMLYYGYWCWRNGGSVGGHVNERRELELWRLAPEGDHWGWKMPGAIPMPRNEWPVWVDYERGELVTAEFPRCLILRALWRLYAWLKWGEPLTPEEREELASRREPYEWSRKCWEGLEEFARNTASNSKWESFLSELQRSFEEGLR